MAHEDGLDGQMLQAFELLWEGESPDSVAKTVGVGRSTLYVWRKRADWIQLWEERREEARAYARQRLRMHVGLGIKTIVDLAANAESESVRLQAAQTLVKYEDLEPAARLEVSSPAIDPDKLSAALAAAQARLTAANTPDDTEDTDDDTE